MLISGSLGADVSKVGKGKDHGLTKWRQSACSVHVQPLVKDAFSCWVFYFLAGHSTKEMVGITTNKQTNKPTHKHLHAVQPTLEQKSPNTKRAGLTRSLSCDLS